MVPLGSTLHDIAKPATAALPKVLTFQRHEDPST
jgi:hypothetical protein